MNITITGPWFFVSAFIAAGIAFAAICAALAGARGHDRITWAVLGFFFGLVALIVLRSFPEGEVDRKRCPDCVSPIAMHANVCKHCGYRFSPA
jgi:hypothetical protein